MAIARSTGLPGPDSQTVFMLSAPSIHAGVWKTELDRIQVIESKTQDEFLIRLIGPGHSLNMHTRTPSHNGLRAVMELSHQTIPEIHRDLVEYDVEGDAYFADAYATVRQRGLDRWIFTQPPSGTHRYGLRSWTYYIIAHLTTHKLFRLKVAASSADPCSQLWHELFSVGRDVREAVSYCPELSENETEQLDLERQGFDLWRTELVAEHLEGMHIGETTESVLDEQARSASEQQTV